MIVRFPGISARGQLGKYKNYLPIFTLPHFQPSSALTTTMVLHLLTAQLMALAGLSTEDVPHDASALMTSFDQRLRTAAAGRKLVLVSFGYARPRLLTLCCLSLALILQILDNVDEYVNDLERLDERGGLQAWLPARLGANLRVVVSATVNGRAAQQLQAMLPKEAHFVLGEMNKEEATAVLDAHLSANERKLT